MKTLLEYSAAVVIIALILAWILLATAIVSLAELARRIALTLRPTRSRAKPMRINSGLEIN